MAQKIIIDTHAHVCDPVFMVNLAEVIKKAHASGVKYIVCVGEDMFDAEQNLWLAERVPGLRPAAGLYPTRVDLEKAAEMVEFIRSNREKLFAIGEVGLDRWEVKEDSQRDIQVEIFKMFIGLSLELDLPLNVHSRSASKQTVSMLLEQGAARVQLHAFDGKASTAMPAVEAGFFFSIPPSVVRSPQKQNLVKRLPLSCLLIETDSPVLGPVADECNEPANAVIAVKAIAEIKGISEDEVIQAAFENTCRLYGESLLTTQVDRLKAEGL